MTLTHVTPRDPEAAAWTASVLCFVASAVTVVFTVLGARISPTMTWISYIVAMSMSLLGLLLITGPDRVRAWLWVPVPLLALVVITVLDVGTRDATASGQVFLCLPVLYAASELRPLATAVVTTCALVSVAIVTLTLQPPYQAFSDLLFVGTAILVMAWLLCRAGQRQDRLVERLERQAALDALTGLVTRRVLDETARTVIASSSSGPGTCLLLLDVDRFKAINDRFGHPVGDAALVHLARVLQASSRPDSVVSRLGGDEIAILLPSCPLDTALRRAHELLDAVTSAPLELTTGGWLSLSVSIGVAHAPLHAQDLRELYAAADEVLYAAKRGGRGHVRSRREQAGDPPAIDLREVEVEAPQTYQP